MEFPEAEALLEHRAFLRRLARSLVADDQAADDVVQDTFLAALRTPPRPGNLRAWLARVARNFALSGSRAERRRARRERGSARPERGPSLDEALARLELQRRIVDAVLALEEPYRSVVVYRFFHDLRLCEIAVRMNVPEATVRTRLRRAIEQLRGRLDRLHEDRRSWAVALLALVEPARRSPAWKVVGAGAAAALAVLVAVRLAADDPPGARTAPAREAPATAEPATAEPAQAEPQGAPLPAEPPLPPQDPMPERGGFPIAARTADVPPGFCRVPAGPLVPGCTEADYRERATNAPLRAALQYDVWGAAGTLTLPEFFVGRYEVTNAQWKLYLDLVFRRTHVTAAGETLEAIARGHGSEWQAIYAFNHVGIRSALGDPAWDAADPPRDLLRTPLPGGVDLVFYAHATPRHWYGWCKLADLQAGREYCDIRKPPEEAFVVPVDGIFQEQVKPLRDEDFARYPMRGASPVDVLRFAEWAGCHLPSEYEWERAVRADRPNMEQHPFPGKWDRQEQADYFAWGGNPLCRQGPLPVDDARVEEGDSVPYGLRHAMGNVWELTRTFYDVHPRVVPMPPPHAAGLFNYALTAKGGSWGDGSVLMQISTRTGQVGNAVLDLQYQNRADSLGLRLVRHPRPGHDLLLHSIRRLTYDAGRGVWRDVLPHAFAMPRMAGMDVTDLARAESPYVHARDRARGIAFAPVWCADFEGGADLVGVLRSDWPLVGADGHAVGPGEWLVLRREGALVLADALRVPQATLPAEEERVPAPEEASLEPSDDGRTMTLRFRVEEGPWKPPAEQQSSEWALCEVIDDWPGRQPGTGCRRFEVRLRAAPAPPR